METPVTISVHGWDDMPDVTQKAIAAMAIAVRDFLESPKWWVGWEAADMAFEIHTPWWISGYACYDDENLPTICAAVAAETEEDAKAYIIASHDTPPDDLQWRFCEERRKDWQPFSSRFPRGDWMKWL